MQVKVCGNMDPQQIIALSSLGVDFAGLIFYDKSPRNVPSNSGQSFVALENVPEKVGVFVNESFEIIVQKIKEYGLKYAQLHGDESPEFCQNLRAHAQVIKVFRINDGTHNLDDLVAPFSAVCDYYLFDKKSDAGYGGTGEKYDWSMFEKATIGKPFFLSGGIGFEDVERLRDFIHPHFYGIDLNSKFEIAPGKKNLDLLQHFLQKIRSGSFPIQ